MQYYSSEKYFFLISAIKPANSLEVLMHLCWGKDARYETTSLSITEIHFIAERSRNFGCLMLVRGLGHPTLPTGAGPGSQGSPHCGTKPGWAELNVSTSIWSFPPPFLFFLSKSPPRPLAARMGNEKARKHPAPPSFHARGGRNAEPGGDRVPACTSILLYQLPLHTI